MSQRPPNNPIPSINLLIDLSLRQLRDLVRPLQPLHQHLVLWSGEVHEAVPCVLALLSGRGHDAVDVGPQQPVGELRHCIAKVDDCVARKRLDVAPFGVFARWQDLEATEAIEEDGDGAEVGMFAEGCLAVVHGLGRGFDDADLVAAIALEAVQVGEGVSREVQVGVQLVEDHGDYAVA